MSSTQTITQQLTPNEAAFVSNFNLRMYPLHPGHEAWRAEVAKARGVQEWPPKDQEAEWHEELKAEIEKYEKLTKRTPSFKDGSIVWRSLVPPKGVKKGPPTTTNPKPLQAAQKNKPAGAAAAPVDPNKYRDPAEQEKKADLAWDAYDANAERGKLGIDELLKLAGEAGIDLSDGEEDGSVEELPRATGARTKHPEKTRPEGGKKAAPKAGGSSEKALDLLAAVFNHMGMRDEPGDDDPPPRGGAGGGGPGDGDPGGNGGGGGNGNNNFNNAPGRPPNPNPGPGWPGPNPGPPPAAPQAAGGNFNSKTTLKFQKLSKATCTAQEFGRFQRSAELAKAANRLSDQDFIYHVLGNLVGDAADSVRSFSDNVASYNSLEDFFKKLKERFVTTAHTAIAKQRFGFVMQGPNENIRVFHNRLHTLWRDSFAADDEPWLFNSNIPCPLPNTMAEPGRRCLRLIDRFLVGLRSEVIRVSMRNNSYLNKVVYDDYNLALEHALALDASLGQIKSERQQHKISARAQLVNPTFDDARVHHTYDSIRSEQGGGVPMELGYAKKGKKGRKVRFAKRKVKRPQRRMVHAHLPPTDGIDDGFVEKYERNAVSYCSLHKSEKHNDRDCRAQRKKKVEAKGPNKTWGSEGTHYANKSPKQHDRKKGKCFNCGKQGHWQKECRVKRGKKRPNLGFLSYQTTHDMSSDSEGEGAPSNNCLTTRSVSTQGN